MNIQLVFPDKTKCEFRHGNRLLARYDAETHAPVTESPRPCLHPVCTLGGDVVTDFRPVDHPWHHGIGWTLTYINGNSYWGGPTYQRSTASYEWLKNHGCQLHKEWKADLTRPSRPTLCESIDWLSADGAVLLAEARQISARLVNERCWCLSFESTFTNVTKKTLRLSSPVGEGRPEGGYFGLTWRGPQAWTYGRVFSKEGESGPFMGKRTAWFAYERAAINGNHCTLVFADDPADPQYPTFCFVRDQDYALASFASAYYEPWMLEPGSSLDFRHDILLVDGKITAAEVENLLRRVRGQS